MSDDLPRSGNWVTLPSPSRLRSRVCSSRSDGSIGPEDERQDYSKSPGDLDREASQLGCNSAFMVSDAKSLALTTSENMDLAGGYADPSQASADFDDDDDDPTVVGSAGNRGNALAIFGNQQTMNINPLIVTNIVGSPYFKVSLFGLKTYHEVVDEIYYKVAHLEPWERGSRKTSGQTGMCGGVRGVGAGGIVSSAYCLLLKLGTLKLTRKQVNGLINHSDSPYIRGLGFMYIRYSQPPQDFWDWYEGYLDDEEEIDVKAGGGKLMTIGEMVRAFMERLEWFDTRFPRIPVNVQKQINQSLEAYRQERISSFRQGQMESQQMQYSTSHEEDARGDAEKPRRRSRSRSRSRSRDRQKRDERKRSRDKSRDRDRDKRRERDGDGARDKDRKRDADRERDRKRDGSREKEKDRERNRDRDRDRRDRRSRSRSREKKHHKKSKKRSRSRDRSSKRPMTYEQELKRYSEHREKHKKSRKSRSRSRSRD